MPRKNRLQFILFSYRLLIRRFKNISFQRGHERVGLGPLPDHPDHVDVPDRHGGLGSEIRRLQQHRERGQVQGLVQERGSAANQIRRTDRAENSDIFRNVLQDKIPPTEDRYHGAARFRLHRHGELGTYYVQVIFLKCRRCSH